MLHQIESRANMFFIIIITSMNVQFCVSSIDRTNKYSDLMRKLNHIEIKINQQNDIINNKLKSPN